MTKEEKERMVNEVMDGFAAWNGLEITGGILVKVRPDDSLMLFRGSDVSELVAKYAPKYRTHLIGFTKDKYGHYQPLFDEQTQSEWNSEYKNYISRKAAWCQKYGSE